MPNSIKKSKKSGLQPGSLIYVGDEQAQHTKITLIYYNEQKITLINDANLQNVTAQKNKDFITWINISGLNDVNIISQIGKFYGLHPLIIEDILNTEQRPKLDVFENYLFIILRIHSYDEKTNTLNSDQISLILGHDFVITIQEKPSTVFNPIKDRLQNPQSLIRKKASDYLAHALLDASVDTYYQILETLGDVIEKVEEQTIANPTTEIVKQIHALKRNMIFLRKSVWPLREIISGLYHKVSSLIKDSTMLYLKDVYDHTVQVIDTVETYRDLLSGMMDIYVSSVNNKLNEVMKVLTIFATIFIPLTFVCSLYGMNFDTTASAFNMPELHWRYGYIFVLSIMLAMVIAMLAFFKRKKWM